MSAVGFLASLGCATLQASRVRAMGDAAFQTGQMTFAEAALLDPDQTPGELDGGRFVPVSRSTWRHGRILIRVGVILDRYASTKPSKR